MRGGCVRIVRYPRSTAERLWTATWFGTLTPMRRTTLTFIVRPCFDSAEASGEMPSA